MSALLHPVGPESAQTYWMRRAAVIVVLLVVLALLVWLVSRAFTTGPKLAAPPAQTSSSTPLDSVGTSTGASGSAESSSSSSSQTPATPGPTDSSATPTVSTATPSSSAKPSASSASPSVKPSSTPSPTGPVNCDPQELTLVIAGDADRRVKSGSSTTFYLTLANNTATDCHLDLALNPLTLTVTSGTDEIWSTTDCASWAPSGKVSLKSKTPWVRTQNWSTQRSIKPCKLSQEYLRPGTYVATAALSGGASKRFVFMLVG